MRLILDSNEFIFALGPSPVDSCAHLLDLIGDQHPRHEVRVLRTIVDEVRKHLPGVSFDICMRLMHKLAVIDEIALVPFHVGARYESLGLKPGDAMIAAYADWVGADLLVTENRHFLVLKEDLPFRILKAEDAIPLLSAE